MNAESEASTVPSTSVKPVDLSRSSPSPPPHSNPSPPPNAWSQPFPKPQPNNVPVAVSGPGIEGGMVHGGRPPMSSLAPSSLNRVRSSPPVISTASAPVGVPAGNLVVSGIPTFAHPLPNGMPQPSVSPPLSEEHRKSPRPPPVMNNGGPVMMPGGPQMIPGGQPGMHYGNAHGHPVNMSMGGAPYGPYAHGNFGPPAGAPYNYPMQQHGMPYYAQMPMGPGQQPHLQGPSNQRLLNRAPPVVREKTVIAIIDPATQEAVVLPSSTTHAAKISPPSDKFPSTYIPSATPFPPGSAPNPVSAPSKLKLSASASSFVPGSSLFAIPEPGKGAGIVSSTIDAEKKQQEEAERKKREAEEAEKAEAARLELIRQQDIENAIKECASMSKEEEFMMAIIAQNAKIELEEKQRREAEEAARIAKAAIAEKLASEKAKEERAVSGILKFSPVSSSTALLRSSATGPDGVRKVYDRDFLLQFQEHFKDKPNNLPQMDIIVQDPNDVSVPSQSPRASSMFRANGAVSPNLRAGSNINNDAPRQGNAILPGFPRQSSMPNNNGMHNNDRNNQRPRLPHSNSRQRNPNPRQQSGGPTIALEDVKPLELGENRFRCGVLTQDAKDALIKSVKGIMNKLAPENFDKLAKQIVDLEIDTQPKLRAVINVVFDKALSERFFSELYANLCGYLSVNLRANFEDEYGKSANFRRILLNKCQEEFLSKLTEEEEQALLEMSNEERLVFERKIKDRAHGNIIFIGELYKLNLLTEKIMHECIRTLLCEIENPDELDVESLCKLMTTIGSTIDCDRSKQREFIDSYFNSLKEMHRISNLPARFKFMILDLIDLRSNNWKPRVAMVKTKSSMSENRKDGGEQNDKNSSNNSLLSSDRGKRPRQLGPTGMVRGVSKSSSFGSGRGGGNTGNNSVQSDGGWMSVAPLGGGARPGVDGTRRSPTELVALAPRGGIHPSRSRGSAEASSVSGRGSYSKRGSVGSRPSSSIQSSGSDRLGKSSQMKPLLSSNPNPFGALMGDSPQMGPKDSSTLSSDEDVEELEEDILGAGDNVEDAEDDGEDDDVIDDAEDIDNVDDADADFDIDAAVDDDVAVASLSSEELVKKVKSIMKEFFYLKEQKEAIECIAQLLVVAGEDCGSRIVEAMIMYSLEQKDFENELSRSLLRALVEGGVVSSDDVAGGLEGAVRAFYDQDLETDAPLSGKYLGAFIGTGAIVGCIGLDAFFSTIVVGAGEDALASAGFAGKLLGNTLSALLESDSPSSAYGVDVKLVDSLVGGSREAWISRYNVADAFPIINIKTKFDSMFENFGEGELDEGSTDVCLGWLGQVVSEISSVDVLQQVATTITCTVFTHIGQVTLNLGGDDVKQQPSRQQETIERKLVEKYGKFLLRVAGAAEADVALRQQVGILLGIQTVCHSLGFPSGMCCRWLRLLYELEIVCERSIGVWINEYCSSGPGAQHTVEDTSKFIEWLATADVDSPTE